MSRLIATLFAFSALGILPFSLVTSNENIGFTASYQI